MVSTRNRKRIALQGNLRQKRKNGQFYYRLYVSKGVRKEFALKTTDPDEAANKAFDLDSLWLAPTAEVAYAQMKAIRGFSKIARSITLEDGWDIYRAHPDRATPHSHNEQREYHSTYREFVRVASEEKTIDGTRRIPVIYINDVTPRLCEEYSAFLKSTGIAVDTHNRKIKRLGKIFECLKEYYEGDNPFRARSLKRNPREEIGMLVHRQAFTKEQEDQILAVLSDSKPRHRIRDRDEIRIIYTIGMFTGQRLKDCVLLQWQNVDMKNRRIWVKQFKTGQEVTIPIADKLYEALLEAEKWKCDQYVAPKCAARYNKVNAEGKNIGGGEVDRAMLIPIRWIGLEHSVKVPGRKRKMLLYGFHSLRHSFASFCAEAGVPKATLLSILGTNSEIADKYYTHVSEASQRKAVEVISNRSATTSQEKIDLVLKLLAPEDSKQSELVSNSTLRQVLEILKGV